MGELELAGLHEDGEHLVLVGPDGQRFRLRIDEPLRAAVRRDRPKLEQLRAERYGTLAPREIQARIRSGQSAQTVAESADIPVEHVRRYEGPVLAEREHIAGQARGTRVGRDAGAPVLGDLVTDRLAARGVPLGSIQWDAFRDGQSPWTVVVRFLVNDEQREALWTFNLQTRAVTALEDEARWLSETELADEPIPRRHLAAVRDVVFDVQADGAVRPLTPLDDGYVLEAEPEPDPAEATAALLDDLSTKRGIRQQLEEDDGETFEGFGPQHTFDFGSTDLSPADVGAAADLTAVDEPPAAHPAHSDPASATDTRVLARPGPRRLRAETPVALEPDEPVPDDDTPPPLAERPRIRRGRASVPSWDEIVFGAKPE
ncbi:septation protein SepH [Cellulomonas aerilata]|uniref:DUF3071 domain-containing protein n=1 Tax=Cellulomonas aerilata TaxID=515326 RepID=A0A512DBC1_9CELL|nr:septation protein SepH [Cellulomonas aerilata]GEO33687.1 hypothetical protein CAE01nite_14120 [Cellulomonas aerilata]